MSKNKYNAKPLSALSAIAVAPAVQETAPQEEVVQETGVDEESVQAQEDTVEPSQATQEESAPSTPTEEENVSESVLEAPVATPALFSQPIVSTAPAVIETPIETTPALIAPEGKLDMNIQHQLEVYAENMAIGKPVAPKDGGMHQYTLYKVIKAILDTEDQAEFTTKFNTLLNFVKDNKTKVFSESYVYRFPEQWPGSESEFANFRRILMVVITTCDNAKRTTNLASLNMEKALEGFTEKQKNRVIVFYGM